MKQIVNQVAKVTLLKQDRFQTNVQQFEGTAKATITFNLSKGLTSSLTMKLNSQDPLLFAMAGGVIQVEIQSVARFKARVQHVWISGSTTEVGINLIEQEYLHFALNCESNLNKLDTVENAVFGVVSYIKLGSTIHTAGMATCGDPFSLTNEPSSMLENDRKPRSSLTMRFNRSDVTITLVPGDEEWQSFVDDSLKEQVYVVGINRNNGEILHYDEIQVFRPLISAYISWINGCHIPVFATKYQCDDGAINLELPASCNLSAPNRHRSFFPHTVTGTANLEDMRKIGQQLWEGFSIAYADTNRGESFQSVLNILHNHTVHEHGGISSFFRLINLWACSQILYKIASDKESRTSRSKVIMDSLNMFEISKERRMQLTKTLKDCDDFIASEFGTSQIHDILGKLVSKMVHAGESANLDLLEKVNSDSRERLVMFLMWLIDLLMLKITNYNSLYVNRLTGAVELVPWERDLEHS